MKKSMESTDHQPETAARPVRKLVVARHENARHKGVHYLPGESVRVDQDLAGELLATGKFEVAE